MSDDMVRSRREEYADATRTALLDAAQALFAASGYNQVGVEAIARAARVTRGAFYHHFADKTDLFDAVVVRLQQDALKRATTASSKISDPATRLGVGCAAFLDICVEPTYRRLVIESAPGVLGAPRCREIEDGSVIGVMVAALQAWSEAGHFDPPDPKLAARMIAGMLCEAALQLPTAAKPARMRNDALETIRQVLAAFDPAHRQPQP
jgi:AcrR family transcriptional regulator